jgi:hypothetical protein
MNNIAAPFRRALPPVGRRERRFLRISVMLLIVAVCGVFILIVFDFSPIDRDTRWHVKPNNDPVIGIGGNKLTSFTMMRWNKFSHSYEYRAMTENEIGALLMRYSDHP